MILSFLCFIVWLFQAFDQKCPIFCLLHVEKGVMEGIFSIQIVHGYRTVFGLKIKKKFFAKIYRWYSHFSKTKTTITHFISHFQFYTLRLHAASPCTWDFWPTVRHVDGPVLELFFSHTRFSCFDSNLLQSGVRILSHVWIKITCNFERAALCLNGLMKKWSQLSNRLSRFSSCTLANSIST